MPYCSRSRRRQFTIFDVKSWAFYCIYGHYHQHFTVHAQKQSLMTFQCKFTHHNYIPQPRFPYRVQNFGDLARFSMDYYILYVESPHIFTSGLTHWPTKYTAVVDFQGDNFHQVWSWCDHPLPSYSVLAADTLRDLDLRHFDPEQLSYMAGHMANPATNFEDLTPICSRVDLQRSLLVTVDAYAATAHAPNHVTSE